ncbi:hypothetical protein OGAPHI_006286 [Ogataea philodendri]|uniref:MutL C-terminal dimerisation domain-containing protein n=1 Tax=Ogataea philodendri TaxID=1378263 RepID=A0A9P8T1M9_9ASCO|nr:uncharacterized protein OGAPHI_006286 [Ogataea philodendri]KAH3662105.1 hypothetical protein OGAPHI_006286 [Ogataea philodendri]
MNHVRIGSISDIIRSGLVIVDTLDVVRELLENSVDSGAANVQIDIDYDGDCLSVRVEDDGAGMSKGDLSLLGRRNWSSKQVETSSFGSRGESLHSIMGLCTRTEIISKQNHTAWKLHFVGDTSRGDLNETQFDVSSGTIVNVVDVFGRVPVRKRHFKAEWRDMTTKLGSMTFIVLACRPNVAVTLKRNGKLVSKGCNSGGTKGVADLMQLLLGLPGPFFTVQDEMDNIVVEGVITKTLTQGYQFLVMNGRVLENRELLSWVNKQFGKDRSASFIFFITTSVEESDLLQSPRKRCYRPVQFDKIRTVIGRLVKQWTNRESSKRQSLGPRRWIGASRFFTNVSSISLTKESLIRCRPICQVENKFILARVDSVLVALDQHACDERVIVERLYKQWTTSMSVCVCDVVFVVNRLELALFEKFGAELFQWGIKIEIQEQRITIRQISQLVGEKPDQYVQQGVIRFLEDLDLKRKRGVADSDTWWTSLAQMPDFYQETIKQRACREAIRFGKSLTNQEQQQLLNDLVRCKDPMHCAHGRPTCVPLIRWHDK